MKRRLILTGIVFCLSFMVSGQKQTLELAFTAIDGITYTQLDSIKVVNQTQNSDTVLYWPDTILVLDYQTGLQESIIGRSNFHFFQNYPNPVESQTTITFYVPERDQVNITIFDILGKQVMQKRILLNKGLHSFSLKPGNSRIYLLNAFWRNESESIKIINQNGAMYQAVKFDYTGKENSYHNYKTSTKFKDFFFNLGDELLLIGYSEMLQSGKLDIPEISKTDTIQFATNIPCPSSPTVIYEGQLYNTIQIFSQCWLKENLNIGTMIPGAEIQQDNEVIEKYCYNDDEDSCTIYGGLYQWTEMMQYKTTPGKQGICPPGWHIPTDFEWKVLEGAVDSQFGINDPEWDEGGIRGYDVGINLKATNSWNIGGNGIDLFGFSGLPSGACDLDGSFNWFGDCGYFWSSSEAISPTKWSRALFYNYNNDVRHEIHWGYGISVRCLKNN